MSAHPLRVLHASEFFRFRTPSSAENLSLPFFVGQLSELSCAQGAASLTLALHLIYQAQQAQEPVAWIGSKEAVFFAPDAESMGIDLRALPVLRADNMRDSARYADKLLRSGGFGLVILDLCHEERSFHKSLPTPLMGRLMRLAEKHRAGIVFLTRKKEEEPSLGSLVSWRGEARWERIDREHFALDVEVLKDKRRGPGQHYREVYHGPPGMC